MQKPLLPDELTILNQLETIASGCVVMSKRSQLNPKQKTVIQDLSEKGHVLLTREYFTVVSRAA